MTSQTAGLIGAAAGVAGVVVAVPGMQWLVARGGWSRLAAAYAWTGERPQPATRLGYGMLNGWMGYKHCLIVAADDQALYLSVWRLFSLFHAPLRIPWARIERIETKRAWLREWRELTFKDVPGMTLALLPATFDAVRAQAARAGLV